MTKKTYLLLGATVVIIVIGVVALTIRNRRPLTLQPPSAREETRLAETLPLVTPPSPPPPGEYDAQVHGDESAVAEDWLEKHPIYSSIPDQLEGFYVEPTDTLYQIKITLQPKTPRGKPGRESELKALQEQALGWLKAETSKLDPNSEASRAYPKWRENHPARDFDQRRGVSDLKIIWQQSQ